MSSQVQTVAYYRVSTARQGVSGLGLEGQRVAVAAHLARTGATLLAEYTEVESGKKADRPQLAAALARCQNKAAVLVIAKLDRLARDVKFLSTLMKPGKGLTPVDFVALDLPGASPLVLHIMAAIAENEATAITQRTKAALAVVRARGFAGPKAIRREERAALGLGPLGWPPNLTNAARQKGREAQTRRAAERNAKSGSWALWLRNDGKTLAEIADALTSQEVRPPQGGGGWTIMQVARLLRQHRRLLVHRRLEERKAKRRGRPPAVSH